MSLVAVWEKNVRSDSSLVAVTCFLSSNVQVLAELSGLVATSEFCFPYYMWKVVSQKEIKDN